MQADALADQLGRQEIALDELAKREDAGDHQDGDIVGPELHQATPMASKTANQGASIGNECQEPCQQANREAEFQSGNGQGHGIEGPEQKADGSLAADKPGHGRIDCR